LFIPLGAIFTKILGDIRSFAFIADVKDTGDKLFTDVKDTDKKLLPLSLTPVIMPYSGFSSIP
jgi:hypothetical protein